MPPPPPTNPSTAGNRPVSKAELATIFISIATCTSSSSSTPMNPCRYATSVQLLQKLIIIFNNQE